MVKSDYEGDAYWVREKIKNPSIKIKHIKKVRPTIEGMRSKPFYGSRTSLIYKSQVLPIDTDQPIRKLVIKRLILIVCVLLLFLSCLFIRIYLPKSYLPCIPVTNESIRFYKSDHNRLCHSNLTMYP